MIHVCYGLYDRDGRYSKFTGTSMFSMFENTNRAVTVHILHDNTLSADNRDKFSYIAGMYGQTVKFYNVEKLCADKIAELKKLFPSASETAFTLAMFYRLFIPNLLADTTEKVLYLDSDVIVNLDIRELWQIDLGEAPLAAIPEIANESVDPQIFCKICRDGLVKGADYFNSGVLIMNLKRFRAEAEKIRRGLELVAAHPDYVFMDQDVLNYCFSTEALKLPRRFNRLVGSARRGGMKKAPCITPRAFEFDSVIR